MIPEDLSRYRHQIEKWPEDKTTWTSLEGSTTTKNLTRLIHNLIGFDDSYRELIDNSDKFDLHCGSKTPTAPRSLVYAQTGPLRECRTIYLANNMERSELVDKSVFPKTFLFLNKLKQLIEAENPRRLTRAYVTNLGPGKQIYPHNDTVAPYFDNIERYQFYYTGTDEVLQIVGDTLFPVKPGDLYYLDHKQIHSYHNKSSLDLMLMVFDLAIV